MTLRCRNLTHDFTQKITVNTNDPGHARETLACKGRILEPLTLKPRTIHFGRVSWRDVSTVRKKAVITRGDSPNFNLKLVPAKRMNIETSLKEIEPGERYELEFTLRPPFMQNRVITSVKLDTGVAEAPTVTLPVYATIIPKVAAQPTRFTIPRRRQSRWEQGVRLVWDDDAPHKILSATVSDADLKVLVSDKDGRQQVVLQVPKGYQTRRGGAIVTVKTDDTDVPTVEVPVFVGRAPVAPRTKRR